MLSSVDVVSPVAAAAREGLLGTTKTLPPWLFYDEAGSELFEQITELPEYYLTRTERGILQARSREILEAVGGPVTVVELGAGTATKTGIVLRAAAKRQGRVLYQPVDVSGSALDEARRTLEREIPGVVVTTQVANYITDGFSVERPYGARVLALYIGSSIGNFTPAEALGILRGLRGRLERGDCLLLGTDLGPGPNKTVASLMAAYDDAAGVTAAFNRNVLVRLNRELGAGFEVNCFRHLARWNAVESRMEMHLESLVRQAVTVDGVRVEFAAGETIHTENSYKFDEGSLSGLLGDAGFAVTKTYKDAGELFAVTLATAV